MKTNAPFNPSPTAEREFMRSLRKIARVSGHIVDAHVKGAVIENSRQMMEALEDYARILTPWATRQSSKMLEQVMKSNRRAYNNKSKALGLALKMNVAEQDVGRSAAALLYEQVNLITSIPKEAGLRAQNLALDSFYSGTRAGVDPSTVEEIKKQLGLSTQVAESRAMLIARTETARANAIINQSRAVALGSRQYRWHNSGDGNVREAHEFIHIKGKKEKLQGMICSWDDPLLLDDGTRIHPGTIYNCRCYAEGIFSNE